MIQVIGDEIWFDGYLVARLTGSAPATVRAEFVHLIDGEGTPSERLIDEAYDRGFADAGAYDQ